MKAYIINGMGGCGKDTFVDFCKCVLTISYSTPSKKMFNISSVAEIKEIAAEHFGYYGQKSPEWRKALSDLKDIQTKMNDGPFQYMLKLYNENKDTDAIMFFHIREPHEIERFQTVTGAQTILVTREGFKATYGNHADDKVNEFNYDHVIENYGTLPEFKETAENFVKNEIKA